MQFNRDSRVEDTTAKQDRIQIDIGAWTFSAPEGEFNRFVQTIAERNWGSIEGTDIAVTPLNRPQSFSGGSSYIKFASRHHGGVRRQNAPLINGKLLFRRLRGLENRTDRFQVRAQLSLNPTRALVYQPKNWSVIHHYLGRIEVDPDIPLPELRAEELPYFPENERVINPIDDNVIIGRLWRIMSLPDYWSQFRDQYIEAVVGFLREIIEGTFREDPEYSLNSFELELNLKQVETYWEFFAEDPIGLVCSLTPTLMSFGQNAQNRVYENVVSDFVREGNIPVLTARLKTGLVAKIYPKTNRRIRIEATHNLQKRNVGQTGHTFIGEENAMQEVIDKIEEVAGDAENEINQMLEVITDTLPPLPTQATPYRLVREIIASTNNIQEQDFLLSAIINNGCFVCRPGDALRPAIKKLEARGVLRRGRRNSRNLILCANYIEARETLSERAPIEDHE